MERGRPVALPRRPCLHRPARTTAGEGWLHQPGAKKIYKTRNASSNGRHCPSRHLPLQASQLFSGQSVNLDTPLILLMYAFKDKRHRVLERYPHVRLPLQ